MNSISTTIASLDQLIRQGRSGEVRGKLESLLKSTGGIPKTEKVAIARLCRRAGIPVAAVRLLHPVVRPSPKTRRVPSSVEQAEYCASLAQIGADTEASELLAKIDHAETPEALLFGAFACFPRWEYRSAIPLLRRYIAHPKIDEYSRCVGQVNLGAALIFENKLEEAIPLLRALNADAEKSGNTLISSNTLLLLSEAMVEAGDWQEASALLNRAQERAREVGSLDALYIEKWRAILALQRDGVTASGRRALREVRTAAERRRHWETLRDCDFHEACASGNRALLDRVFHGTPHPHYRRRIEKQVGAVFGRSYTLELPGDLPGHEFELFDGKKLKPGQLLWRLSRALTSDFYRPMRLATLHSEVFPRRHFHPVHSPTVIHQAIKRLRSELKGRPLRVEQSQSLYRLTSRRRIRLFLPDTSPLRAESPERARFESFVRLREAQSLGNTFTRENVQKLLGISERSAAYFVRIARENQWIHAIGHGPARLYRI